MMIVTATVQPTQNTNAQLLCPTGFNDGFARCTEATFSNAANVATLALDFAGQQARMITPEQPSEPIVIRYCFEPTDSTLPETFWQQQHNRYTNASADLTTDIEQHIDQSLPVRQQIEQLIRKAKSHFDYGHGNGRFYDGTVQVPAVCGTTRGSCVDINTYLLAGAQVLNLPVQYVAGYWFHPEKTHTFDMHCWMVFRDGDEVIPWDLAHHMKWGVDELSAGLNPAGGRRVPMSFGRGLQASTAFGNVTISHFSEPLWCLTDGTTQPSQLTIAIEE